MIVAGYFARSLLLMTVASLMALVSIVAAVTLIEHGGRLQSPVGAVLLAGFIGIQQAYHLLPMACLLGAALSCVQLGRRGEFIALQTAGVSTRSLGVVAVALFTCFSVVGMLMGEWLVPYANRGVDRLRPKHLGPLQQRSPWVRLGDYMLHLPEVEQTQNGVRFPTPVLYRLVNDRIESVLEGEALSYSAATGRWSLDSPLVHAGLGSEVGDGYPVSTPAPLSLELGVTGTDLLDLTGQPQHLGAADLLALIDRRQRAGFDSSRHWVVLIQRYAHPWLGVLLFLVAAPWLLTARRERTLASTIGVVAVAIGVVLAVEQVGVVLALGRKIPPWLASGGVVGLLCAALPVSGWWQASAQRRGRA